MKWGIVTLLVLGLLGIIVVNIVIGGSGDGTFVSKASTECPGVLRVVESKSCPGEAGCSSWLRFSYMYRGEERNFFTLNNAVLSYKDNTLKLPKDTAIPVVLFDKGRDGVPIFVNPSEFSESEFRTIAECLKTNIPGIQTALAKTEFQPNFIGVVYADGNKNN